jgi:phospholipid/cholesterol/gamma-HCH transport system substrate-binding protein
MQSRNRQRISPTLLQSAVGLMLLASGVALIGVITWLADFSLGGRSYRATFLFPNVGSMVVGTRVGYRGVRVGQVERITPEPEGVAVDVRISPADRIIPSNSVIEAVQSGLVGETRIDITPLQSLPTGVATGTPLSADCESSIIICNGSRLQGQAALDVNSLIRSLLRISNLITDPELVAAFRSLTQRTSTTLGRLNQVSGEATTVLKDVQRSGTISNLNSGMRSLQGLDRVSGSLEGLGGLSQEAKTLLRDLQANGGLQNLDSTLLEARKTLATVGKTAEQISLFLSANQNRIVGTLDSIQRTSDSLQTTITRLDPMLSKVEKSQLIDNLEQISANAAVLSGNLSNLTVFLGDPETVVTLQKLLDSARVSFENIQKLTSDLDEITGDPQLRQDLIRLIQGLSNLVSSTQQLQQDILYGQALTQMATEIAPLAPTEPPTPSPTIPASPAKKP